MIFVFRYKESFGNYTLTVFAVREGARARVGVLSLIHNEFMALKQALAGKEVLFIQEGREEGK